MSDTPSDRHEVQLYGEILRLGELTRENVGVFALLARAREGCRLAQALRERFPKVREIEQIAEFIENVAAQRRRVSDSWPKWLKQKEGR